MSDNSTETGPDTAAAPHEWHVLDDEAGLEVRQVSPVGEPNRYEVRHRSHPDKVTELDQTEFNQLREAGPNPKGL